MSSLAEAVPYVGTDKTDDAKYVIEDPKVVIKHFGDDPTSFKWNELALVALEDGAEILVLGSDDIFFESEKWVGELSAEFERWPDRIGFVGFNDGRSPGATPHFALHRNWVEALGYFVPPFLFHWCVDTWTADVAKKIGRHNYASHIMCRHLTTKLTGNHDETHLRIRRGPRHSIDMSILNGFERYRESDAEVLRRAMR